jgi:hypothetical protein
MKSEPQVEANYERPRIVSPYTANNPPRQNPLPEGIELDREPMQMSNGQTINALSPGEVCLQNHMRPGFVHDFVMAMRGTETTTLMSIWGALFTISGALQRRSWQDWVIERLYPNLYLIFIARPGICKKTVSISFGAKIMNKMADVFDAADDKEIYPIPTWNGGTTSEYLFTLLKPREITINDTALGMGHPFMIGSRLAIVADELTEFLGKQKYKQGIVSRLTKLYDCPENAKVGTQKDKTQEVRNVFVNFCGGTTPDSFRDIIPGEARGGGLMSRFVLVWQEHPTRQFYRPQRIKGVPDQDELARRLAWIAEHRMGEYRLTEEADHVYQDWYVEHKANLANVSDSDTRADIILMKTAHLIAASGYERGQHITEDDMRAAIFLVDLATEHKKRVEKELLVESSWSENIQLVSKHIKRRGVIDRSHLMRGVSYKMNADELNKTLIVLQQSGKIKIDLDGQPRSGPGIATREQYIWQFEEE